MRTQFPLKQQLNCRHQRNDIQQDEIRLSFRPRLTPTERGREGEREGRGGGGEGEGERGERRREGKERGGEQT